MFMPLGGLCRLVSIPGLRQQSALMAPDSWLPPALHAGRPVASTLRTYEQSTFFSPEHSRIGWCLAERFKTVWGDRAEYKASQAHSPGKLQRSFQHARRDYRHRRYSLHDERQREGLSPDRG